MAIWGKIVRRVSGWCVASITNQGTVVTVTVAVALSSFGFFFFGQVLSVFGHATVLLLPAPNRKYDVHFSPAH